jgi:hypothetical protein
VNVDSSLYLWECLSMCNVLLNTPHALSKKARLCM